MRPLHAAPVSRDLGPAAVAVLWDGVEGGAAAPYGGGLGGAAVGDAPAIPAREAVGPIT